MYRRLIYLISLILVLCLVGSAWARVLYSDSFNRPNSDTLGTNDNALGGIIIAPWVEVETDAAEIQISGNAVVTEGGNCNGYIDHKFTGAELSTSFTVEFDVVPTPRSNYWFALEFGSGPASFTTGLDVNQNRMTFGFLMRPQTSFIIWDGTTRAGVNSSDIIDNSSNPARVKLEIDSPDGYSDGNTATVRVWINDVLVEDLFGSGGSFDFGWDGHTDGLYISFENHQTSPKSIDNLVISNSLSMKEAVNPSPENEATDVLRETVLSWVPGEFAQQHDVYFGTVFNDVNDATTTVDPAGVYVGRQSESTYAPDRPDLGRTYYWRIDEVNAPPDNTVFTGDVWSFTVEPIAYPIADVNATASSSNAINEGPENTINGSGLDDSGLLHGNIGIDNMWLSSAAGVQPTWIQYEFDKVYKLHQIWVWNHNTSTEPVIGFGIKEATIEYSTDGANWTTLGTTHEFARGTGTADYESNTTVDLSGVVAKYVKITANSNWGGFVPQYGLSEVRFFYIPIRAREPSPLPGATDVDPDVTLAWRAGREVAQHDVYVSTDEQAVIDATAPATILTETSHGPLSLDLDKTYYWKVNEVNMAETPITLEGDVWHFTTREFLVVDDFESYNDLDPGDPESNRIFNAWVDGYEQPANGSIVGYPAAPFAEQDVVHSGGQSMPLFYDNTGTARYSEAELTLNPAQDWTKHGVNALSLWFSGDPNNVPDQMYVKINGSKVIYDGDTGNLRLKPWQPWNIDLASLGIDVQNVTKLGIGFGDETSMMAGGSGVVFVDDIRLYPYSRQLATPVEPNVTGLVAHYEFEGTASDSSDNGLHGTVMGEPAFAAGKIGQAISLDGFNDFVEITGYKGILGPNAVTVTAWINTTTMVTGTIVGWGPNVDGQRFGFRINDGRMRMEHAGGNVQGDSTVNDGRWHHVAVTVQEGVTISYPDVVLYVDGIDDTRPSEDPDAFNLTADLDVRIGSRPASNDRFFMGLIDDVRIYDRALTSEEVAWLAGRTEPFDKPF